MAAVHTQIETPLTLRKTLLSTALETAEMVKQLETLERLHLQKANAKNELQASLRQLQAHITTLKKGIPPLPREFIQKQQRVMQKSSQAEKAADAPGEVDSSLDADIYEIKRRLEQLTIGNKKEYHPT